MRLSLTGAAGVKALDTRAAASGKDGLPTGGEIDAAGQQADQRAQDAKALADGQRGALALADPGDAAAFEKALEDASAAAHAALRAGPLAVDDTVRDEAVQAAAMALAEIVTGVERLAKEQLRLAAADLATERDTTLVAVATARDNASVDKVAAGKAFDQGKAAIGATAASLLSGLLLSDTDVKLARDAASSAAVKAALPGATRAARIEALTTACDADQKMATAVNGKYLALAGAVPAFPGNENSASADPAKLAQADGAADKIRAALAGADANCGALARWRESGTVLHKWLQREQAILAKITAPSTAEAAALVIVSNELVRAEIQLQLVRTTQGAHSATAPPLQGLIESSRKWTTWTNEAHGGSPANKKLQDAHGFVVAAGTEGARGTQNGAANSFSGAARDTLVRAATGFDAEPYAGPTTIDKSLASGETAWVDMTHICGRHVSQSYDYAEVNDSGPLSNDHKAGQLLLGKYVGQSAAASAGEQGLMTTAKAYNEVNSLLPDTVTRTNLADVALKVLEAVQAAHAPAPTLASVVLATVGPSRAKGWVQESVDIDAPPEMKITVGLEFESVPPPASKVMARMMYAADGDTLTMADMLTIGRALGM